MNLAKALVVIFSGAMLVVAALSPIGCSPAGSQTKAAKNDPYSAAIADIEDPAERTFIEASQPILEAVAKRDYEKLFTMLSGHALAKVDSDQFGPVNHAQGNSKKSETLLNVTKEKFLEMMGEMEKRLAVPKEVDHMYVQTIDPNELAGKADNMSNMFNLGGMPAEIPFEIRKASIRAQIRCQLSEEAVQQIAKDLKISEEKVRSGKLPTNDLYDEESWPYLNLKFVLVEEGGQLKIGYFEFMPPSIMD